MVTHRLQVWCRPVKVRRSETDVLPLSHPTQPYIDESLVTVVSESKAVIITGPGWILGITFSTPSTGRLIASNLLSLRCSRRHSFPVILTPRPSQREAALM